jgi:nucleotide-binding universal stress UspA family protein
VTEPSTESRPVVVGVDGSEPSKVALAWAAHEASLRKLPLTIVLTWEFPAMYGWPVALPENIDYEAAAKTQLQETVTAVLGDHPEPAPTAEVLEGHPALVLRRLSEQASLLVVGSRGHGGFSGMLLGSVSEYLAAHSHCPLVILHGKT